MTVRKSMVIEEIQLLLDLFLDVVPDRESNRLVWKFCEEKHRWVKALGLFTTIRDRNLKAIKEENKLKEAQYCFEEVIAKTLSNLTRPDAAFDPDSPYWVIKNALRLAQLLNLPAEKVNQIVT
jgi:hypothetical protein